MTPAEIAALSPSQTCAAAAEKLDEWVLGSDHLDAIRVAGVALLRHAATLTVQTNPRDSATVYRHELTLARAILGGES